VVVSDGQLNLKFHDGGGSDVNWLINSVFVESVGSVPLSVSVSPASVSMIVGESQTFTASASGGSAPYSYQWYLDGGSVAGAFASTWVFTPVSEGDYSVYVIVTDELDDTAQSNTASVTVSSSSGGEGSAFDFGSSGSPVESGYVRVTESTVYSGSLGYGWGSTVGLGSRDRGSPDSLRRDFVFSSSDHTFNVDVSNGEYQVTVTLGDENYPHDLIDVFAEGGLVVNDLSTSAGVFAVRTFSVVVSDGQLNLKFHDGGGSSVHWIINAITIESI
jgi:hypothetical protein